MGITFSDPDVDSDENTVQIAALTPTDNGVIIGNGTAWTVESGSTLRSSLGLAIGSDVQAFNANLTSWAAVTPGSYLTAAAAAAAYQPLDTDLTAWAGVNPSSYSTTAQIAAAYQPLDSDLTSWAGVTRASGFDTFAATPSSANLRTLISDETGTSGGLVFAGSPTLITPVLGVATATSINGLTITTTTGTITITNGKTLSVSNSLTLTATDGSTLAIGAGGTLGTAAYKSTGTSGNTVPLLDAANTFSQNTAIDLASGITTLSLISHNGGQNYGGGVQFTDTGIDNACIRSVANSQLWFLISGSPVFKLTSTGGAVLGSPTGGDKGAGTLNATAVYDDNSLLTDLVLDMAVEGRFDKVAYVNHPIASEVQDWWFDADRYAQFWKVNRHLPGMVQFTPNTKPSTGESITRLTAVIETQAALIESLNQRLKALGG